MSAHARLGVAAGRAVAARGGRGSTVLGLARVEALRLLEHPVFLAGVLLSIALGATFEPENEFGGRYFVLMGPMALPLALATLVAVNLAALRTCRSGTGELYHSLAAPPEARTLAHLASAVSPIGACAALVGVAFLAYRAWDGLLVAPTGATAVPSPFELAQGPVAVAAVAALGVALARWLPYLPAAPVAAVGLLVFQMPFALWNFQSSYVWFAPLVNSARTSADSSWPCSDEQTWPCLLERFATESLGWHLLYLAGLATFFAAVALLREERRARYAVLAAAGLGVAAAAGIFQIP